MKKIAIIPARGGSKRIPKKNIKLFCGKPVISYSIEAAIQSKLFDEVMVSTDAEEIAKISIEYGANVPFLRSTKNSDDYTGPGDVIEEVLLNYENLGQTFDFVCCIYATSPLIKKEKINEAYNLIINSDFDTIFPVAKFSNSIWRSLKLNLDNSIEFNFKEYASKRSQDISDSYYDVGQFYWLYTKNLKLLQNKNLLGIKKGVILLDEMEAQDIDNLKDWEIAEFKFEFLNKSKK
jgi:pseudaminic acid cytidylyltransferase